MQDTGKQGVLLYLERCPSISNLAPREIRTNAAQQWATWHELPPVNVITWQILTHSTNMTLPHRYIRMHVCINLFKLKITHSDSICGILLSLSFPTSKLTVIFIFRNIYFIFCLSTIGLLKAWYTIWNDFINKPNLSQIVFEHNSA